RARRRTTPQRSRARSRRSAAATSFGPSAPCVRRWPRATARRWRRGSWTSSPPRLQNFWRSRTAGSCAAAPTPRSSTSRALARAIGGLSLFDDQAVRVAWPLVLAVTAVTVAFFLFVIGFAIRGRRGRRASGKAAMLGRRAEVIERLSPRGRVRLDAEVWNA